MKPLSRHRGVYTGTFDPIHLGHLDVIARASRLFEELIIGVGINPEKSPLFSLEERVEMVREVVAEYPNVTVREFTGLAVRFVREMGALATVRGLRTVSDMEYEFTMSLTNMTLDPEIETVFLMAKDAYSHLSSSLLRQVAQFGGDLTKFLPPQVHRALEGRVAQRRAEPPAKKRFQNPRRPVRRVATCGPSSGRRAGV